MIELPTTSTVRRRLHWMILMGTTLLPAACTAQTPSCSDDQVGAKVKELMLQRLSQNYDLSAMYDLPATRFDLRAIRTVASDERHVSCRADLAIALELNSEMKAAMEKPSRDETATQMMKLMFGNNNRSVDLRYSVERTDDGKDLYISIQH
ncbi:hypothetical protein MKK75_20305 [Methylobacterium sp. J-030]|uniref:hypothetical protein n=1 Tax=Methylobacterium sp. J-030 TaxID=2836627 RepID=UPI001FBA7815|nr:hypothetical protein [Methylobacterium sp. J-030]MCJ2071104.1 hypothetical protein [Methylobacterium sp. J-030]